MTIGGSAAAQREVNKIVELIPSQDLALQWDVCWEVLDAEGIFPWTMRDVPPPLDRFQNMVERVSSPIPEEVLLGYHLCYADLGHQHMKEPQDLSLCVEMANIAAADSGRSLLGSSDQD